MGAGAWGTALANIAANNGKHVTLWVRENKLVDDIVAKWKVFRPVDLLMTVGEENSKKKEFPGTPKRDMTEYGELVFKDQ